MKRGYFIRTTLLSLPLAGLIGDLLAKVRSEGKAFMTKKGESRFGESFTMKGVAANHVDVKVSGKDTDGAQAVLEVTGLTYRGGPPLHLHHSQDEIFYVVEGQFRFQVGSDSFSVNAGDTIFLPRGVPHAHVQLTEQARMVVLFQPAGRVESFFRTTAAWTAPPGKEEIARVFAEHEMKVVGPPLKMD